MPKPCTSKRLSIQLGRDNVFVLLQDTPRNDCEVLSTRKMKRRLRERRTSDQVQILAGVGKDTHLSKRKPRRHRARIIVSRQANPSSVKTPGNNLPDPLGSFVRPPGPDIEIRSEETRLVSHVIAAGNAEERIKSIYELRRPTCLFNQRSYILGHKERISQRVTLVKRSSAPAAVIQCREWRQPATVAMPRKNESHESTVRKLAVPKLLPVTRSFQVLVIVRLLSQPLGKQRNLKVIRRILHVDRPGTVRTFDRYVAEFVPIVQPSAAFLEVVRRRYLGVANLGSIRSLPVDAFQPLHECIGNQKFRIAAALCAAVVVAAACVRQPAFVAVKVHQRAHNASLAFRSNQSQQRP